MFGFHGRILEADLAARRFVIKKLSDEVYTRCLGGKGLAAYLLHALNPPGADPLGPDNCLVFATGPVTGSRLWGSSRFGVYTRSPLTGFFCESYSGGKVPESMDAAGFDAVVLRGRSARPAVLVITPDGADFHDAGDLWGADTYTAEDEAVARYANNGAGCGKPGAVVIGPAGENLVRFAVIENDYWRSAGRTGPGAVMGSKRVKAIVFQGDRSRPLADANSLEAFAKEIFQNTRDNPITLAYKTMGTPKQVKTANEMNLFPSRYWSQGRVDHRDSIGAEALHARCDVKARACAKCYMACGRMSTIREGRHKGLAIEGPEYETIYAFGGLCMVDSIEEIAYLNDICDRMGMDTITAGNLCGLAIEASRAGKIEMDIDYNNVDAIAGLLRMIARREGAGDVLADGILRAAKEWDMEDAAVHVKGLEPAGYDPRVLKGMGLGYAVSDRGACHLRSTFYKPEMSGIVPPEQTEGKAGLLVDYEDRITLFDTLIACRFYRDYYQWDELARILAWTTGITFDKNKLRETASRVSDLVRWFNIREGLKPADDNLPRRLYREKLEDGSGITEEEILFMRKEYYRLRGWDEDGTPKGQLPRCVL